MTHPTSLLAEYVDDALAPPERKRIETHLSSCDRCAAEVEAAAAARAALSSLPDEPVPVGVTSPVIAQASARSETTARPAGASVHLRPPKRRGRYAGLYRVVAAAAVIAIVGVFVTSLFRNDDDGATTQAMSGSEDFMKFQDADPGRFDRDGNYTAGELTAFAEREVRSYRAGYPQTDAAAAPPAIASATPAEQAPVSVGETTYAGDQAKAALPPGVKQISNSRRYRSCLDTIGAYDHGGRLVSSFEGRYLDVPAYFATLTEGPDVGEPHDRLVVWVLRKTDCWVLAFTQQRFASATPTPLPTDYMHPVP